MWRLEKRIRRVGWGERKGIVLFSLNSYVIKRRLY